MGKATRTFGIWILLAATCYGQSGQSPYAGQQSRQIKSLSADEVSAYLEGQGMGLAKAAELNQYPGPKHVLELAAELQLTDEQRAETRRAFEKMKAEAVRLGNLIVEKERELDSLFAGKKIDSNKLRQTVGGIARLQGELRVAHLQAHLEMRQILSPAQVEKYDRLRGYDKGGASSQKEHKHGSR